MLFSKSKWNNAAEISPYVPASTSLSFSKMEHALASVEGLFLFPLLGPDMLERLQDIYDGQVSQDDNVKKLELQSLEIAQRAEANLAFWWHFDALNLRITDQGFQRQQSEEWVPAYKYQEDRMREKFHQQGFNALDALIDFLSAHIDIFTEYRDAETYTARMLSTVRNRTEAEQYLDLGHSQIVFLRLRGEFTMAAGSYLQSTMGTTMYDKYNGWISDPSTYPEGRDVTLEQLRQKCVPVIVFASALRLVQRTGTLTDRGLYFEAVKAAASINNTKTPANDKQIGDRLATLKEDLLTSQSHLKSFLRINFPEWFDDAPGNIVRDNDNHNAFFAI